MRSYRAAVNSVELWYAFYHFVNGVYQEADLSINNNFWRSPAREGNDRASLRHGLDHHHAERLFPFDGIEEAARAAEQAQLLCQIHRPDVFHLVGSDVGLDGITKVVHRFFVVAINDTCQY